MGSMVREPASTSERGRKSGVVTDDNSHHIHRSIYNTKNTFTAPVTTIHQANTVNLSIPSSSALELLNTLPKHPDTSTQWSDYLEDSRGSDLTRIRGWGDDLEIKESMLWVYGPAGTGKSTLARQLVYDLQSQNRLAASLFLSVLTTDTFGPDTAFRLIGGEIGRAHHKAIPAVAEAVRRCHSAALPVLVDMFIRKPLESLHLPYPLIIVMDATDEWRSHYHFITELGSLSSLSYLVRFVVLSRSEPRPARFKGISIRPYHLEPVSIEVVRRYLRVRFEKIEWPFGRKPPDKDILGLATMASGLFIWIANVCSLLERPRANPHETLTAILHHARPVDKSHVLAKLYFDAIEMLFPEPDDKDAAREFLGFMLILQEPLPLEAFASLSGIDPRTVKSMTEDLKALQIRRPADSRAMVYPISMLFHASFGEYLQSTSTPPEISFAILLPPFHLRLGIACLTAVSQTPPTPADLNLSPKSTYGVKLWPYHIVAGSSPEEPDLSRLRTKRRRWPALWRLAQRIKALILNRPSMKQNKPTTRTSMVEILEDVVTLGNLCQWAPLFLKILYPDYISDPPSGDNIPSLMRAVAALLDTATVNTLVFQIPCLEVAVRVDPYDAENWGGLCNAYKRLGQTTDSVDSAHQFVRASQHALDVAQASQNSDCTRYMRLFAVSLGDRAERLGTEGDIEKAISVSREALKLCPSGHPDRSWLLSHLAASLHSRFKQSASPGDLEEAIVLHREGLELCPPEHPARFSSLNHLAISLHSRFKLSASAGDLEEAIVLQRDALELRPSGHPDRSWSLGNLANSLHSRFKLLASTGDLEEAIVMHREALELRPLGHPDRSRSLGNLANSLSSRFEVFTSAGDLEEAIVLHREALEFCPSGHPDRSLSLNNLANSLGSRFKLSNSAGDLEEAIVLHREALELRQSGHPDRWLSLNNLAASLHSHFELSASAGDLDEAIMLHREALELRPAGRPDRSSTLYNLASTLHSVFQTSRSVAVLEEAIVFGQEALLLQPTGHPRRPHTLWYLRMYLHQLFIAQGAIENLQQAISLTEEALALYPADSPYHSPLNHDLSIYVKELELVTNSSGSGLRADE